MHALSFSLLAIASGVAALPSTAPRAPNDATVLVCTGENYMDNCSYLTAPFNTCQTLPAPFYKNVGSFRPDSGILCRITL